MTLWAVFNVIYTIAYNECSMSKRQKAFSWLIYQPPNKAVRFVGATFIETEIDSFL
jgi:hypothetical protein